MLQSALEVCCPRNAPRPHTCLEHEDSSTSPSTCMLLPTAEGSWEQRTPLYLSLGIDVCLVLQQKLHQLDVPIMAGHMQRGIAHLKDKIRSLPSPLLTALLAWICSSHRQAPMHER